MLKIGWSTRDVSTNEPVLITGQAYERISKGSFDPTTVTVLVLANEQDSVIFVSGDFTSFVSDFLVELKEKLAKEHPEIPGEKIILNATHTHTAPRYQYDLSYDYAPMDRLNIYPPEKYRAFLLNNLVSAIWEAYSTRKAGSIAFGTSSAEVSVQRRCVYFNDRSAGNTVGNTFAVNGHGVMYGSTKEKDFSGYEGSCDATVSLLYTFDEAENLTGAIVNVPCPSQCTEHGYFTSADYWHETRELIRKKHGNIFILPQCAAAGDLSPHRLHAREGYHRRNRLKFGDDPKAKHYDEPWEYYNRRVLGERIAHAFDECLEWASREKLADLPLAHRTVTVPLEAWKFSREDYEIAKANFQVVKQTPFAETDDPLADFKENTRLASNIGRYEKVIQRFEEDRDFYDTEIHVLKLGDMAFVTCPFELYLDYQHRIQGRSPALQTFLVQLTASSSPSSGYLATEKAAANKGYSAISFSCNVSPAGGQKLVETALSILQELYP